jgi:hypothetical protein
MSKFMHVMLIEDGFFYIRLEISSRGGGRSKERTVLACIKRRNYHDNGMDVERTYRNI